MTARLVQSVTGLALRAMTATACGTATGAAVGAGAAYDITKHNR